MFRTISDFLNSWKTESESTLKILRALSDESLRQRVTPEGRSLGCLAWHLTITLGEMLGQAGLQVAAPPEKAPAPDSAGMIAEAYEGAARSVGETVKASWTDAQLSGEIPMYGEQWTRSFVLGALVMHQCHHRGQMTVLMRQASLKVPGTYGPAREEWATYGMEPQD